jgi:hypothetical protein
MVNKIQPYLVLIEHAAILIGKISSPTLSCKLYHPLYQIIAPILLTPLILPPVRPLFKLALFWTQLQGFQECVQVA